MLDRIELAEITSEQYHKTSPLLYAVPTKKVKHPENVTEMNAINPYKNLVAFVVVGTCHNHKQCPTKDTVCSLAILLKYANQNQAQRNHLLLSSLH